MLRPERMSKVSVTGSKRVIDDVIEATYEHHSLHVTDYDERYGAFRPASRSTARRASTSGSSPCARWRASSMSKTTGPTKPALDDEELEAELADVRDRVNDLNDRRDDFKAEIRDREEEIDRMEPFADLGIELDLLGGYDSLEVVVGEAKPDAVERRSPTRTGSMRSRCSPGAISSRSSRARRRGRRGRPAGLARRRRHRTAGGTGCGRQPERVRRGAGTRTRGPRNNLDEVESELAAVKEEAAGFLLRAEDSSPSRPKKQAPLSFATTENAFIAEGWVPTETFPDLQAAIANAVGDHAEVEELERASFTPDGDHHTEAVADGSSAGDAERRAATDGGHATHGSDDPPVVQDNGAQPVPSKCSSRASGGRSTRSSTRRC